MKKEKIFAGILVASFIASPNIMANSYMDDVEQNPASILEIAEGETAEGAYFLSVTGQVKEITKVDVDDIEHTIYILETEEGGLIHFVVDSDTYVLDNAAIEVGDEIIAAYSAKAPAVLIYPPQYKAITMAKTMDGKFVKTDLFNDMMISSDGMLQINIEGNTEVVMQDGSLFDGDLVNRNLLVVYDYSTRSIPAQTSPEKVVVLFEKAVPPIHNLTEEEKEMLTETTTDNEPEIVEVVTTDLSDSLSSAQLAEMEYAINGKVIEAPKAYKSANGTVMVPLRAIAEELGYQVAWEQENRTIHLDNSITLRIGVNSYDYMRVSPITLTMEPVIVDGVTFVPLKFFTEVAQLNNAYVFEGQIVINDEEKMQ